MQERTIEQHRGALLRILAMLWQMAGLGRNDTILRSVHRAVARLLRPAEAAARRLIVLLARDIAVTLPPARATAPRPDRARCPVDWVPFALADPLPHWPDDAPRAFAAILPGSDGQVRATRLALRFDALFDALHDLPAQAQRLARWQARRRRARQRGAFCATQPLRPGSPPDLHGNSGRRLRTHELSGILRDAHDHAWWALNAPPNTS